VNIYLGEHFEKFIREQVATGRYANASEVVREALRDLENGRLAERERTLASIQKGLEDLAAGRVTRVNDLAGYFEQIRHEAHEEVLKIRERALTSAST
jgi:antitoxin ParD1/3/4